MIKKIDKILTADEAFSYVLFDHLEEIKDKMIQNLMYIKGYHTSYVYENLKFEIDDRLDCVFRQFYFMRNCGGSNVDIDINKNEVLGIKFEFVPSIWCALKEDPQYKIRVVFNDNSNHDVVYVGGRGAARWASIADQLEAFKTETPDWKRSIMSIKSPSGQLMKAGSDMMDFFRYGIEHDGFFNRGIKGLKGDELMIDELAFKNDIPEIKDVKYNGPATVVLWADGTKTVVKAENEEFDPEKGLAMAIAKKCMGTNKSKSNYYDIFKKWIPEEEKKDSFFDILKKLAASNNKTEKTKDDTNVVYGKMSVAVYCERSGYSKDKVYRMIKNGELDAEKDDFGHWMIFLKRNE